MQPDSTTNSAGHTRPAGDSPPFPGFKGLSANFTQTPNQFFDRLLGFQPYCVVAVVGILIRATLGWADEDTGERRVEAELPLSAFLRPELCESSARKGLRLAVERGFVVKTGANTNRDGARYALRWADPEAQTRAIAKQRRAQGARPRRARKPIAGGVKSRPPESRPPESRPLVSTPPPDGPLKETSFGKEKESVKGESPAASGEKSGEQTDAERAVIKRGAAQFKAALEEARRLSARAGRDGAA